jgi:hypothetical protein
VKALALPLLVLLAAAPAGGQRPSDAARVVVVVSGEDDARIGAVREAVGFWNATFEDLGLEPALRAPDVLAAWPSIRALENYAWQISRRAGRASAGALEPPPPAELVGLDAEVVVLLSAQRLMPFAWPLAGTRRHFVAVAVDAEDARRGGMLRVIAHELGHTLGLRHDRGNSAALMCMPCDRAAKDPGATLPPLGPRERARLLELHGSSGARDAE